MTVYLWENIEVVPGQTAEYMRAFAERWLPLSDAYDRDLYRISGFFTPDVLNTSHPAVRALWTLSSWETWDGAAHTWDRRGEASEDSGVLHAGLDVAIGMDRQDARVTGLLARTASASRRGAPGKRCHRPSVRGSTSFVRRVRRSVRA